MAPWQNASAVKIPKIPDQDYREPNERHHPLQHQPMDSITTHNIEFCNNFYINFDNNSYNNFEKYTLDIDKYSDSGYNKNI